MLYEREKKYVLVLTVTHNLFIQTELEYRGILIKYSKVLVPNEHYDIILTHSPYVKTQSNLSLLFCENKLNI